MKVTRQQAAENHRRILDAAGKLFREKGFDGIGVADIMKSAGLTHGGFYGHFASKDDLAVQACGHAPSRTLDLWTRLADNHPHDALATIVRSYLSTAHRDDPGGGCLFAALSGDVARRSGPVRRAFTERLHSLIDLLTGVVPGRWKSGRRKTALATLSGLVGALILARAVDDASLSDEILKAVAETFGASPAAAVTPVGLRPAP